MRAAVVTALAVSVFAAGFIFGACKPKGSGTAMRSDSGGAWPYPVRLGDSRAQVHGSLGNAARVTEVLEEYPLSGVTVWYNPEGRVAKLNFAGLACAVYSLESIPSDRQLMFGLTAHTDEAGFRQLLGNPVRESVAGAANAKEARVVWRKDGYVIDALFLASERAYQSQALPLGRLVWFEISPGV